jgi:hypothetical protein
VTAPYAPAAVEHYSFHLDPELIEAFSLGDCWHLAKMLESLTGWEVHALSYDAELALTEPEAVEWEHMVVRHPSGYLVDITGVYTDEALLERWFADRRHIDDQHAAIHPAEGAGFLVGCRRSYRIDAVAVAHRIIALCEELPALGSGVTPRE